MKTGRIAILLCLGAAGLAAQAPTTAPAPAPVKPQAQAQPALSDADRVERLRTLVEAAEKALEAEDDDTAADRADEAEVLVADWDQNLIERPDVQILFERLKGVQNQVSAQPDEAPSQPGQTPEPEEGLKEQGQVTILQGRDLSSELAKVQAAEQGTTYDFPIDLNDKVLTWVRLFTTDKRGYMERTLDRGEAYFPMIRQVFAEEGIPQDLAYLGVVESGYINQAKSYARAVGMWQFMPSTGRLFGLKINRWIDERRDPVKATHAAARYLRRLYEGSGDWYLALVGYNAGPLTTQKAQTLLGTSNFWDMYRSPYLRNQTKNYIPEMCAAVLIARNPQSYGFAPSGDRPFVFETIQVPGRTRLSRVASAAGVAESDIRALNPQLLRGETPPGGSYEIRVPVGCALQAQRRFAGVTSAKDDGFESYTLRRGDTPAKVARRFGVEEQDLLKVNRLRASAFRPGRRIRIPEPAESPSQPPALPPALPPTLPPPGIQAMPAAVPSPAPAPVAPSPVTPIPAIPGDAPPSNDTVYRAKPGDTLAKIARAHGLSLAESMRLNPAAAEHLAVGDAVILPAGVPAAPTKRPSLHVVRRGETLFAIASEYRLTVAELKRWNHLRSTRLRAGQRLRLAPR
ncbi:MAG: LysM peptidoglycan-binding domain-containing protein [Acidobacteria bacterium]|nr:LysM peptidoglycan-binding domain-containing protein [Acidobacteriota bacterium]